MIYKILKYIYILVNKPKKLFLKNTRRFFKFILPNLKVLITHRVKFEKIPICTQKLLLSGAGTVEIGKNCSFGFKLGGFYRSDLVEIQARYKNAQIKIGNNVATNNNIFICAANYIEIGDDCLVGKYVTIMDHEAHGIETENRRKLGKMGEIIIGKNVWIGNNVTILKNSEVGKNSIIAVGAIVSGKFPENVIIGGVPAKIIRIIE